MAENEQLRSAEAEQQRNTENTEEEESRFGEGEEDEEEAFSPLPESAEQVPKYYDEILYLLSGGRFADQGGELYHSYP